jgi:hypothetical protein
MVGAECCRGRTSSSGVLGALYCLHRGARRGVATSVAGEEAWPPGPRGLIEASAKIVEKTESVRVFAIRRPVPLTAGGSPLPFIGQGEDDLQACHTIFLCVAVWRTMP